jgi:hypothetical protein
VLLPGAVVLGVDSLDGPAFRDLHVDDVCVPLDPATVEERLHRAGFQDVEVVVENNVRFVARTPATP